MDIQELIKHASDDIQSSGTITPMVLLEQSTDTILIALHILADTQGIPAQCGILARIGRDIGKKYANQKPTAIGLYMEAWATSKLIDPALRTHPSRDPDRREIVMVEMWQEIEPHFQSYVIPILRDDKGTATLGPAKDPKQEISYQLLSFLHGVKSAQLTEGEMIVDLKSSIFTSAKQKRDA